MTPVLAKLRLKPTSGRPSLLGETRQAATSKILPHLSKIGYMKMSSFDVTFH